MFSRLDILAVSHRKQEEIKLENFDGHFFFPIKAPHTLRSFN